MERPDRQEASSPGGPRPDQVGMERHYTTSGLEVVGQDMDNYKSNLTPPSGMLQQQSQQHAGPSQGYFAPSQPQAAQRSYPPAIQTHPVPIHGQAPAAIHNQAYATGPNQAYATGHQHQMNEGYQSSIQQTSDGYYSGNHPVDQGRATIGAPTIRTMPMSEAGQTYSPTVSDEKRFERYERPRTVCGVLPATFFLSLTLAAVVLIAAIGGGVGGTMAVKEARTNALAQAAANCSARQTAASGNSVTTTFDPASTVTNISAQKFKNPGQVITELDCPGMDGKEMTIRMREKDVVFKTECATDYYLQQIDLISTVAYSFENCVRACAAMNSYIERTPVKNATCIAVVFNANMLGNVDLHGGNCWLKSKIGEKKTVPGLDTVAAAILQQAKTAT